MFDISFCDTEMNLSIDAYSNELKNIRTGRISPDILKSIIIDSYGSKMPLTQLSNVNNIDNMTLSTNIVDESNNNSLLLKNSFSNIEIRSDFRNNKRMIKARNG